MLFITTCEIIACLGGRVSASDQQLCDRLCVLLSHGLVSGPIPGTGSGKYDTARYCPILTSIADTQYRPSPKAYTVNNCKTLVSVHEIHWCTEIIHNSGKNWKHTSSLAVCSLDAEIICCNWPQQLCQRLPSVSSVMSALPNSHPWLYEQFVDHGFHVIQRSGRFWSGLLSDHVIESTLMRYWNYEAV